MIQALTTALVFVTIMVAFVSGIAWAVCWWECKKGRHFWRYHPVKTDGALTIVAEWRECKNCDHWEWE